LAIPTDSELPGLDVVADLAEDARELLVLRLLGEDRQRAQQGQPSVDHRRELAREDREVLELTFFLPNEISLLIPRVCVSVMDSGA
jgi:hypothetical protein